MTYPDPNDSDPTTGNGTDLGEAPVSVRGDNGRNKLGRAEGEEQRNRGTLHEEESVGPSDEDERLRDDGNLEVDDHVEHTIAGGWDVWQVLEADAELLLEEVGLQDDDDEHNGGQGKVQAVSDGESEDLREIPAIWSHRWQNAVN